MPHAAVSTQHRNRAKQLRAAMTRAETLLWSYLKAGHLDGLSFRRQAPIGAFVVDFVCHSARIVIELDGESHDFTERLQRDHMCDRWLTGRGYTVLRFTNDQVLKGLEGVLLTIADAARVGDRATPPSLFLPRKGGGNAQTDAAGAVTPLPDPPPQGWREKKSAQRSRR
jgi:very-short-patch-repair endonuclease